MPATPDNRPFDRWLLMPVGMETGEVLQYSESASSALILELLRTQTEVKAVGRGRFPGSLAQRNRLWLDFRNYMRQAMSNFEAAATVPNRSAGLLLYYAMLNFAKATLLDTHAQSLVNRRIGHGLSFSPTAASNIRGDQLKVVDGVFPLLYERVVGRSIPIGTVLPVTRLLHQVPEIATQVKSVGLGECSIGTAFPVYVTDGQKSWSLLALWEGPGMGGERSASRTLLRRHYRLVNPTFDVRDVMAFSRRSSPAYLQFWESKRTVANTQPDTIDRDAFKLLSDLGDILWTRTTEDNDGMVAPSLFSSQMLPMPPSLARYAVTYYISSLVRYKPQMFDQSQSPEVAYLFDTSTREMALPMLLDTLSWIENKPVFFNHAGSMRL